MYCETIHESMYLLHYDVYNFSYRDWNGSKRGQVYKFLRSQGFVSSYDQAHHYTDNDADCHKVYTVYKYIIQAKI